MSSIEERLARDIAAVTGGVVVTESDLRDARDSVDERIDSNRRRDRRRTLAAAAAVVAVVGGVMAIQTLGGDTKSAPPANPGPTKVDPDADFFTGNAPTVELVTGLWREDNGGTVVIFREDGTVRFDQRGTLFSDPLATGTYEIDGDVITVTTAGDGPNPCDGVVFTMRASIPEAARIRSISTDAPFRDCPVMETGRMVWEQMLPTPAGLAEYDFSGGPDWQPLSDRTDLYGVRLGEGGGYVLEIDRDGTYYVADESGESIDQGAWTLRSSDLTLTSSADSATCDEGDQYVLGGVEQDAPGTATIRGAVERNTCGAAWAVAAWMPIPNEYS